MGDVSATPAVVEDDDDRNGRERDRHGRRGDRGRRGAAVYFPDWGGWLWKLDARDGDVAVVTEDSGSQRHSELRVAHESGRRARDGLCCRSQRQPDGGRCRERRPALDHGAGSAPGRHHHDVTDHPGQPALHRRLVERDRLRAADARLCLLHVPRQHRRARRAHGTDHLADVHAARQPGPGRGLRRRRLRQPACDRRRAWPALCGGGEPVHAAGGRDRLPRRRAQRLE